MQSAIEFNNVSKLYRLGLVSTGTLYDDIHRLWVTKVRHKEDPYLKIGETNDRSTKGDSQYVWALRDINFKVDEGDVVGIIGKNGAGKSTLLKILSRVTAPTTGNIRINGRISSLLEVGTGFHPEMTGRENIYLNGAILGMTKAEITQKLDEIVDFSGCERYIDTPVKRYSSGMMVRLGFAVAAHLDTEIMVVDEVLAVGDAEFQKKAIGKMHDVSKGNGRTVLFVSHNMASVRTLCKRGIVLNKGSVSFSGPIHDAIDFYLNDTQKTGTIIDYVDNVSPRLQLTNIQINGSSAARSTIKQSQKTVKVLIEGNADNIENVDVGLNFRNYEGTKLARFSFSDVRGLMNLNGPFSLESEIILPDHLHSGSLKLDVVIHRPNVEFYLRAIECCILEVEGFIPYEGVALQITSGLLSLRELR